MLSRTDILSRGGVVGFLVSGVGVVAWASIAVGAVEGTGMPSCLCESSGTIVHEKICLMTSELMSQSGIPMSVDTTRYASKRSNVKHELRQCNVATSKTEKMSTREGKSVTP